MAMLTRIIAVKQNHSNKWTTPVNIYAEDNSCLRQNNGKFMRVSSGVRREKEWTIIHNYITKRVVE